MPKQTITWTALPVVRTAAGAARVTVHIGPRLTTDEAYANLSTFPDWKNWPDTLSRIDLDVAFFDLNDQLIARSETTRLSTADSVRWTAVLRDDTQVDRHTFRSPAPLRIWSYPSLLVSGFLAGQYGKFGALATDLPPTYEQLAAPDSFAAIGFENYDKITGATQPAGNLRKKSLRQKVRSLFATGPSSEPDGWAIDWAKLKPLGETEADRLGKGFLLVEQFLSRGKKPSTSATLPPALPPPDACFHDFISLARDHQQLQRILGIAVDLETTDPAVVALLAGPTRTVRMKIVPTWRPRTGQAAEVNVTPATRCVVGNGRFRAVPRNPADFDVSSSGLLQLGTDDFLVEPVDLDGGGIHARQFADTVTRSRIRLANGTVKYSSAAPDRYALPALRTAGFGVYRDKKAVQLAFALGRNADLNATGFTVTGDRTGTDPEVFAEDLLRGYRWDVFDVADNRWRSLMRRAGAYEFHRLSGALRTYAITEEAVAIVAPGTSGEANDSDLYQQESLVRWTGWSLAVRRIGRQVNENGQAVDQGDAIDADFGFGTRFSVPDQDLPRLRFGRSYQFRARAVDLAGNSVDFQPGDFPGGAPLKSAAQPFGRFEPVPAPDIFVRVPRGIGESADIAAVRSNTGADNTAATADRHVAPARTSVTMVERHGLLDAAAGQLAQWNMLRERDAARLETYPFANREPDPHQDSWYFHTATLPVPYLSDPMTKRVLVRGLPGTGTTQLAVPGSAGWPDARAYRIQLTKGAAADWNVAGQVLTVRLAPGDIYRLRLSSQFDPADLPQFGLWPWIQKYIATANDVDPATVEAEVLAGRHYMFTPSRSLLLVHAVRKPLKKPAFVEVTATKPKIGATYAVLQRQLDLSRKSTGTVDVIGSWTMWIDDGVSPEGPVQKTFRANAFTLQVPREVGVNPGPDLFQFSANHEFGDTKFRQVTYTAVATTRFLEYFREKTDAYPLTDVPAVLPANVEAATVKLLDPATGRIYRPAPAGDVSTQNANADYVLDPVARTLRRTETGPASATLSFVGRDIHEISEPLQLPVANSARPAAPKVEYVVPTFKWLPELDGRRRRGGLRIYLDRPWYSSGDRERLGILLWRGGTASTDPPDDLAPYVTMWGHDPVYAAKPMNVVPATANFLDAAVDTTGRTIHEAPGRLVDVVSYPVDYDASRGLYFCDLEVRAPAGTYSPFVRLALARYQPGSLSDCHLSTVVSADFIQLTPERTASVVTPLTVPGAPLTKKVTVRGPGYAATDADTSSRLSITLETAIPGVTDENLRWQPYGNPVVVDGEPYGANEFQWQGTIQVPQAALAAGARLLIEEFEVHLTGRTSGDLGAPIPGNRLVFTETFAL